MNDGIMNKEAKENISKDKTIRTHCNKCEKEMNHVVLMDFSESGEEILSSYFSPVKGNIYDTADFSIDYQIIRCSGCDTISYRSYKYFSAIQDIDNDGTWEERFPILEKRNKKEFSHIPKILTQIYKEVIMTYNNDCFILCASGIRAILEGICNDKGITDRKLFEKIKKMREQEIINSQKEKILHKLSFLGNDALHELRTPTIKEIDAALDIIEHIIESLYEIEEKGNVLRSKNWQHSVKGNKNA